MSELDEIFRDFSKAFLGKLKGAKAIAFPAKLARSKLDYSLASLKLVDQYLTYLHQHKKKISDDEWNSTVLYGGAYVGEVIRRETADRYAWIDYDDYIPQHPKLQTMIPVRNTATCAFLVDPEGSMTMPLNKIARYLDEGDEHSVHFFAHCDIQRAKQTTPTEKTAKKSAPKKKDR